MWGGTVTVVKRLVLSPQEARRSRFEPGLFVWVTTGYSDFLPQYKDIKLIGSLVTQNYLWVWTRVSLCAL